MVELLAEIQDPEGVGSEWRRIAHCASEKITVRGRPSSFFEESQTERSRCRRGQKTKTGLDNPASGINHAVPFGAESDRFSNGQPCTNTQPPCFLALNSSLTGLGCNSISFGELS